MEKAIGGSMKKKKPKGKLDHIVEVMWEDTNDDNKWMDKKDVDEADVAICYSVGYLYSKDKKYVKIITSYSTDLEDPYGDVQVIPRGCIKKITTITKKGVSK
jgi:hypothetical protein